MNAAAAEALIGPIMAQVTEHIRSTICEEMEHVSDKCAEVIVHIFYIYYYNVLLVLFMYITLSL
jgi:hypothetical protein